MRVMKVAIIAEKTYITHFLPSRHLHIPLESPKKAFCRTLLHDITYDAFIYLKGLFSLLSLISFISIILFLLSFLPSDFYTIGLFYLSLFFFFFVIV